MTKDFNIMKRKNGFSIIEIMTVVAIIAAILTVGIVALIEVKKQANEANCQASLKTIGSAFETYSAIKGGLYAQGAETNLQFLVDAECLYQDLVSIGQIGNYTYSAGSIAPSGYDIRAMAVNQDLAGHNYQISTGSTLKRSDTSAPADINFKFYR